MHHHRGPVIHDSPANAGLLYITGKAGLRHFIMENAMGQMRDRHQVHLRDNHLGVHPIHCQGNDRVGSGNLDA